MMRLPDFATTELRALLKSHPLQCIYDRLEVYEGPVQPGRPLHSLCGLSQSRTIVSERESEKERESSPQIISKSSATVSLQFVSDSSVQKAGFEIEFIEVGSTLFASSKLSMNRKWTSVWRSPRVSTSVRTPSDPSSARATLATLSETTGELARVCPLLTPSLETRKKNGETIAVADTCGGIIRASFGELTSPNYPANYPSSKHCLWMVR